MNIIDSFNKNNSFFINNLDLGEIDKFAEIIYKAKSNNINILGVGKSYNVSLHFSDLLKCINFRSFAIETSKLMHGDVGLIHSDDLVIYVSNSGNTKELVEMMNCIGNKTKNTYLLTSNKDGLISENVKGTFIVPHLNELESCFGIIPTNSIVNYINYINILISRLIEKFSIGLDVYKTNHSGGNINKLLLTVKDTIKQIEEYPVINTNNTLKQALIEMNRKKKGICLITNDKNLFGIITDGDIRRYLENNDNLSTSVKDILNKNPFMISKLDTLISSIGKKYNYIPVVDCHKIIGVIEM
jgi:arabinose-5-phosphate isomerase